MYKAYNKLSWAICNDLHVKIIIVIYIIQICCPIDFIENSHMTSGYYTASIP